MVMGDEYVEPHQRLFVTLDEDVCFYIVYELYSNVHLCIVYEVNWLTLELGKLEHKK